MGEAEDAVRRRRAADAEAATARHAEQQRLRQQHQDEINRKGKREADEIVAMAREALMALKSSGYPDATLLHFQQAGLFRRTTKEYAAWRLYEDEYYREAQPGWPDSATAHGGGTFST